MAQLQQTQNKPNQPVALVDDPNIKEVYTDSFVGLNFNQGNLNMVFATMRGDHAVIPPGNHRHITARLVMPAASAVELHTVLGQIIAQLEQQGIIKKAPNPPTLGVVQ
jgi:hypothetical protein